MVYITPRKGEVSTVNPETILSILSSPLDTDLSLAIEYKHQDSNPIRWSQLGKPLPLLILSKFRKMMTNRENSGENIPTLLFGLLVEEFVVNRLRSYGVKVETQLPINLFGVSGTADIYLPEYNILLEVKATSDSLIRKRFRSNGTPKPEYLDLVGYYTQLVAYREALKNPTTYWLLYNKTRSRWEMAELNPTEEEVKSTLSKAFNKVSDIALSDKPSDAIQYMGALSDIERKYVEESDLFNYFTGCLTL